MTVIGLQFDKITLEKFSPAKGKINVTNNVAVKDVEETEINLGTAKQPVLSFKFEFSAKYEPKIADIIFNGSVTYFDKPEEIKEIMKSWNKNKKIPKEVMSPVLNSILSKCNIEALLLAREINLPAPIPLPKVNVK